VHPGRPPPRAPRHPAPSESRGTRSQAARGEQRCRRRPRAQRSAGGEVPKLPGPKLAEQHDTHVTPAETLAFPVRDAALTDLRYVVLDEDDVRAVRDVLHPEASG